MLKGMVLNFQRRFVPMIKDGSKAHTIRGERKDGKRPEPGTELSLWTGLRTKNTEFILRAPCVRTEDVEIWLAPPIYHVEINGEILDLGEMDALAWRDGFRFNEADRDPLLPQQAGCFSLMSDFWKQRLPFNGWITYWDYSKAKIQVVNSNAEQSIH